MKNAILIFLFFAAVYLIPLGGRPLVAPDEFRYAQIPFEMLESGNFAAPHMFSHPYFEKPALGHWLTAASFKMFGFNHFAIRFSSALLTGISALFIGLLVYAALRDRRLAVLSGMMYLCCGMVYALGTFAVLDAPLTMFSTGAMCCAFIYLQKERPTLSRILMLIFCGIFCGLGFMVKGVPAWIVPALGTAGFLIWQKRWKEFFIMPWIPLIFTILTILPWAVCVHRAHGDFWRYFIEVEHLQRFTSSGNGQHPEPWWFFLPFIAGGAFPAAFLLAAGIGNIKAIIKMMASQPLYRFAACSTILPLLLFSCSSGKLATYILPCFAGLSVLMAGFTASALRNFDKSERNLKILFTILGWLFAAAGICAIPAGFILKSFQPGNLNCQHIWQLITVSGICAAASGSILLLTRKKPVRQRLCFFALFFAIPACFLPFFIDWQLNDSKMPEQFLLQTKEKLQLKDGNVQVITIPSLMHAAAWSFKSCDIRLLNTIGEMEYANQRAVKTGRIPLTIKTKEFQDLIRKKERKDILYICWQDRPVVDVPDRKPEAQISTKNILIRYYPADGSGFGKGRQIQ